MISVIIPVYNVEKYIEIAIKSILSQTYQEFELILVNDGSTDRSGVICDKYTALNSKIKVIHKKNGGGGARSAVLAGIRAAVGEYTCFLDSDDFYKLHALEEMVANLKKYDADCVQFSYIYVDGDNEKTLPPLNFEIIEGDDINKKIISPFFETSKTVAQWSFGRTDKAYKTSVLKEIINMLKVNITVYEDFEMSLHIAKMCKKIVILPNSSLYCWRYVADSVSRRINDNTLNENQYFINALFAFAAKNGYNNTGLKLFKEGIYADLVFQALACNISFTKKFNHIKKVLAVMESNKALINIAKKQIFPIKIILLLCAYKQVRLSVFSMNLARKITGKC